MKLSSVGGDWAWEDMPAGGEAAPLKPGAPKGSAPYAPLQLVAQAARVGHGLSGESAAGHPTADEIQANNAKIGCVTTSSPLARRWPGTKVAPVGTPCVFRADARDEAAHCIGTNAGVHGEHGWCWTNLARSEWGSCSSACPLSSDSYLLGKRLDQLEDLVTQLSSVTATMK